MRSTRGRGAAGRIPANSQQGVSLIEALIASALLGITAVVAFTAWDTATVGARQATHEAWSQCVARGEMEAVLAGPWASQRYPAPDPNIQVLASPLPSPSGLERVTVTVRDPQTGAAYHLSALKAQVLSGTASPDLSKVTRGCPSP